MSASELRELLHNYLDIASDKRVRAIYKILEEEIEEAMVDESAQELDRQNVHHHADTEFDDNRNPRISRI